MRGRAEDWTDCGIPVASSNNLIEAEPIGIFQGAAGVAGEPQSQHQRHIDLDRGIDDPVPQAMSGLDNHCQHHPFDDVGIGKGLRSRWLQFGHDRADIVRFPLMRPALRIGLVAIKSKTIFLSEPPPRAN